MTLCRRAVVDVEGGSRLRRLECARTSAATVAGHTLGKRIHQRPGEGKEDDHPRHKEKYATHQHCNCSRSAIALVKD